MKASLVIVILLLAVFSGVVIWQMNAYKVAEPPYSTIKSEGNISIREYDSMIVAEVAVSGERYTAINAGFRLLANYIFGGNKEKIKIAMTAPVIQSRDMTVATQASANENNDNNWVVRFVMPADYGMKNLPQPDNPQIKLIEMSKAKYIVIRFSGFNSESNLKNHLTELQDYISKHQLLTVGSPVYAFYNPPWILPFLRRNEIMLELK